MRAGIDDPISIDDIRKCGLCVRGIRDWARGHDLDFKSIVNNGLSQDLLLSLNDDLATEVVHAVRSKRAQHNGGGS